MTELQRITNRIIQAGGQAFLVGGDGSCTLALQKYPRVSISTGSKRFVMGLKETIENTALVSLYLRKDQRGNGSYTLDCSGNTAKKLHCWLYDNCSIFIKRKRDAFNE